MMQPKTHNNINADEDDNAYDGADTHDDDDDDGDDAQESKDFDERKWKYWTCDEITPDLCPIEVAKGELETQHGVALTYWKYTAASDATKNSKQSKSLLPIIVLHGGPSFTHNYMLPLKQQACEGREIVFYDQAGCGESSLPPNSPTKQEKFFKKYPWLMDPSYYATEELPLLINHLGYKKYHLLGNSWGTILAQLFALDAKSDLTKGLQSMVLSGPISDAELYGKSQWDENDGSVGSLPPFMQNRIRTMINNKETHGREYEEIFSSVTSNFVVRTQPLPKCWIDSVEGGNMMIYKKMQGSNEFSISGELENFNCTSRLHEIKIPVLLTSGQFDTVRPKVVDAMERNLPNVERYLFTKSGHVTMIDEPGLMNKVVADFYGRVEAFAQNGKKFPTKDWSQDNVAEVGRPQLVKESGISKLDVWCALFFVGIVGLFARKKFVKPMHVFGRYSPIGEIEVQV